MTKKDIINGLASSRKVEKMCLNIAHASGMNADLKDLAQVVYLALLEYNEGKLVKMHREGTLDFFLLRIIINQYRSSTSPFYKQFRHFRSLCEEYSPAGYNAEIVEASMR